MECNENVWSGRAVAGRNLNREAGAYLEVGEELSDSFAIGVGVIQCVVI